MDILYTIVGGIIVGLTLHYIFGIGKNNKFSSRFSSEQNIKILPPSLGGIDYLNLDNIATLQLHVPYNMNEINLMLNLKPIVELASQSNEDFQIEGVKFISHEGSKIYKFSTSDNMQKIKIGERVFIVNLRKISKMNVKDVSVAMQYEFGINEE